MAITGAFWKGRTISGAQQRFAAVFDERYLARIRSGIQASLEAGLIRRDIDLTAWIDRSYLDKALKTEAASAVWTKGFPSLVASTTGSGGRP